jgi:hypothetical protein
MPLISNDEFIKNNQKEKKENKEKKPYKPKLKEIFKPKK